MAQARSAFDLREFSPTQNAAPPAASGKVGVASGFFRRLLTAMMESRLRQADREIAAYLRRNGGRFTDDAEREIERRFLSGPRW